MILLTLKRTLFMRMAYAACYMATRAFILAVLLKYVSIFYIVYVAFASVTY